MKSSLNMKNRSSIYQRRVEELLKILNQENDEKKYKNDNELYISYDCSDESKKGYFYRYKNSDRTIKLDEMRKKNPHWEGFKKISTTLQLSKSLYSKFNNIDSNLIEIIYNEKGKNAVFEYLEQLQNGKKANRTSLPYKMKYNLTSVLKSKELSFANKIKIMKMIRKNKHVADVESKTTLGRRIATVFAAMGLLFSTAPKLNGGNATVEKENNNSYNSFIDTMEEKNESEVNETTEMKQKYALSMKEKSRILSQTKEFLERHKENNVKNSKEVEFGTLMQLPEGMQFMEGVSGGRLGMIGDESSPKDGIYVIDYSAEVSEDGVTSVHALEGKIDCKNPGSEQFVHISFVKGASNIDEAKSILEQEKDNMQNGSIDKKIIQPRGWVSKSTVQQFYNMQQKNTQNQDIER